MQALDSIPESRPSRRSGAILIILLLWLAYTTLQCIYLVGALIDPCASLLLVIPGIIGILVLRRSGFPGELNYLRPGTLSTGGFWLLVGMLVFYLFAVLPTGHYTGRNWSRALIYAPLSGSSQEIFFRAALLPVLLWFLRGRYWVALLSHSILFGLWHIGALFAGASLLESLPVILVPALFGIAWGWQVIHDRTILWVLLHHIILLMLMSCFSWG